MVLKRLGSWLQFGLSAAAIVTVTSTSWAQGTANSGTENSNGAKQTTEPVFRVSKLVDNGTPGSAGEAASKDSGPVASIARSESNPSAATAAPHPLDEAINLAHNGLGHMRSSIFDYTATLVKREQVNGKVGEQEAMEIKIRNPRMVDGRQIPFSVYMRFVKPRGVAGREVIFVDGQNKNQIVAHESGLIGFKTVHLDPTGWLAMQNNRHPIYEAGLENLVLKLVEKAERDRAAGLCEVEYTKDVKINGRPCTKIQVLHKERREPYEFHIAEVFIDDELQIPVRYAAYDWPSKAGGQRELIEEYTYVNVKLNVGLTDLDFDPRNPAYNYKGL